MSVWLVVGALLAVVAVLVVALPFLRSPGVGSAEDRLPEPDEAERRRLELSEERDRALAALKELEFDHRTGKVSDDDYRDLVGPLRRRAAETLRALDRRGSTSAQKSVYGAHHKVAANHHKTPGPTGVVEPPQVPEPTPVPSEPPGPVTVPEPSPIPSEPPAPVPTPEPTPEPSPPQPEPPQGR